MPDPMTCFACEREPVQQCSRCGRPYCEDHGEELCEICLQPSSGVPSFSLYRGSLLALLIGTALAVWLLVQPTSSGSGEGLRPVVLTPTGVTARGQTTPTNGTPAANQTGVAGTPGTPGAQTTPAPTATPRPAATGSPAATGTPASGATPSTAAADYTVRQGDTLGAICSRERPSMSNADCVSQLRTLNNISGDSISIGDKLKLP
jgi:hypothetical protein